MPPEETEILLSVRRPGGGDDSTPEMAEALAAAAANPDLAHWLHHEVAFDSVITERLREHRVPEELRARILASVRSSAPETSGTGKSSRRIFLWGAGAAAALATGLFVRQRRTTPGKPGIAGFRSDMLKFFNNDFQEKFDFKEPDPAKVLSWLKGQSRAVDFEAPGNVARGSTLGCRLVPWSGTEVTLVCFMPPASPEPIHVFAVASPALAAPGGATREYVREAGWNTALWARKDTTYMAISQLPREKFMQHLDA